MSQVFSGDAVGGTLSVSVPTTTETTGITGNYLNPPFQNAKAAVIACVTLTVATGTTAVVVRIRRNPNAENFQVAGSNTLNVTAGNNVELLLQGADPIPDGRPVQYAVTVSQAGATGNGTILYASVLALLISG